MNIVHVIPIFQKSSGVATFVGEVANLQVQAGTSVTVATLPNYHDDHYPVAEAVRVITIRQLLSGRHDFTHVHIHGIWTPVLHRVVKWARSKGLPIVWSPHGMLAPWAMAHKRWKKWPVWWLWQRRDLKQTDVFHVTSDLERDWVTRLGFTNRCEVVPLGTHLPEQEERIHRRRGYHTLLFVGRIYPVKGLTNLLEAWALIDPVQRGDWHIRIVGPDQAGHQLELQNECRRLGIADVVEFPGAKFGSDLEEEYRMADCLVLPSFSENFGGVVVDAMAHGVPVIASRFTPWQDLEIAHAGWWVDNDPTCLKVALSEMMGLSDSERMNKGYNGRVWVQEKYTWNAVAGKMASIYGSFV